MDGMPPGLSGLEALSLAGIALTSALSVLFFVLAAEHVRTRWSVRGRLTRFALLGAPDQVVPSTLWPQGTDLLRRLGTGLARSLRRDRLHELRAQLVRAGLADRLSAEEFLGLRLLAVLTGVALGAMPAGLLGSLALGTTAFGAIIGFVVPTMILANLIRQRRATMDRLLPDVVDMLGISLQAGLSFDAAVDYLCARNENALVGELRQYLSDLLLGRSRQEALEALAERVGAPEMREFVVAVIQADQLGTGLVRVLRSQAHSIRRARKTRAETRAREAPIKLLFPVALCIMPVLFIVILGPAALKVLALAGLQ
jgi:tight adherence protein C